MSYINNGVSKSLMEKLSSAAGTAQNANIRNGKKYNTDNLSSSLAQKLGFTTVKGSVSSSGKASIKTQEDENKLYKTLSEHSEWGLNDNGVITDKKDSSYFMKDGQLIKKQDENTDNLLQNSYAKLINSDKGEENSFLNSSPANSTEISNAVKGIISTPEDAEKHFILDSAAKAQENNRKEKLYNEYAEKYKDLSTAEEFITAAHKSNNDDEKVWLNNKANILLQEQKSKENDKQSKENDEQDKLIRLENLNQQKEDLQKELESTEDENKRKEIQNKINAVSLGIGKLKGETKDIRYQKQQEEYAEALKNSDIATTIEQYYKLKHEANLEPTVYGSFGKLNSGTGSIFVNPYADYDNIKIGERQAELIVKSFEKLKDSGIDADALLEYYSKKKENEKWQKTLKEVEKLTDNPAGAIANNAMSVLALLGQGIDSANIIGSAITEMFTNEKQVPETIATDYRNTVRGKTQENIHYSIDNPVLQYLAESAYSTGMSMADFLYTMPFGEASLPILSTSAGTTEAKRLLDDGVSTEKALLGGIAAGIAEGFFEKFSIEQLKMFKQNGASGFKNGIINALKGFTVEGSEEAATDIANAITNTLILQDDSDFTKSYNSYIKDGMSPEESKNKVAAEFAAQVANDFVWGGVSGGIMSAGASVIGNHINRQNTKALGTSSNEIGQAIIDSGDEAVKEIIYNAANNQTNSKLNKLGNKLKSIYESGKDVNPADLGNLQKMFEMQSLNALVDEGLKSDKDTKAYKSAKIISQQIKDGESVNYNSFKVLERNLGMNTVSKVLDENENQIEINKSNDVPRHSNVTISKTIHPNGVAATTDDGRKIVIAQIESADADSDSAYIYTTDGEKLSTDKVKVSDTNYYAILNAASQFDTNGAKAMAVNYEKSVEDVGEISGYDYAKNFYKLYDAGRQGITYEQAVNQPEYSLAINAIGIRASHLAFASAKNDMNPNTRYWRNEVKSISQVSVNNETLPLTSGRIYITKGTELANDDVSNAVAAVDKLAQKAGIDIVLSNKLEEDENGRYDGEHIVINVNKPAEYILSVAFHEVGHEIANSNPEAFNIIKEFVFEYLKKKGIDVNQRINNIKYTYRNVFSAEEAQKSSEEEIVCNALMSIPSEEKAMEVINDMEQDEKRSLLSALKKFIQKIKAFLSKYAKTTAETKAYIGDVENITKLAEMVKNSIIETDKKSEQKNNTANNSDAKYSIRQTKNMSYSKQLEQIENNKLNGSNSLYIGIPSADLIKVGFSKNPFVMNQKDYRKSRRDFAKNKHYSSHGVPLKFFKVLPQKLNSVAILIDNGIKITAITDFEMKDTKGNKSFVVVGLCQNQEMESDKVNLVKSIYPLDDILQRILNNAEKNKLIVINKNKAKNMLTTIGIQPSEVSRILNLSNNSLSQWNEDVKSELENNSVDIRYSLEEPGDYTDDDFSELDSDNDLDFWEAAEGRTLTENERRILEGELADLDRKVSEKVKDTTAILEEMNNLTRDMNVNETDLKKLLRKYCREYSSKKNVDAFTRDAQIVINALKVSKSQEEFNINFRLMCGLFKDMLEKSEGTDDIFKDEREDIKSQLKRINKIVLNQVQYEEAVSAYDGWKNYRNQIFHTANICKPGSKTNSIVPGHGDMSLDEVWATLAEQYPEFFDSSISDGDQPLELIAVLNRLKPQVVNPVEQSGLNLNDLSLDLALKFTADVYDLQYKNVSDEKVQQLKKQFKEKAKELNDRRKVRFDKRVKALQEKAKEEKKLLNAKFKDAVRTKGVDNWLKQQGKYVLSEEEISGERAYAIYEVTAANPAKALIKLNKKKATEYREKIRKLAVYVTRWGVRPNKKVFMPTNFSKAWGNVIDAITVTKEGDTPKIWDNFVTLKDEYSKLKVGSKSNKDIFSDNETQFTPEMLSYSKIIYKKLDEVTNMVKGKTIYDLTGDELEDIYKALQAVVNNIENARNLIIKGKTLEMTGFAIDCMNEIKSTKVKVDNTLKEVLHKYTLASINPQRFFKHISNYDENSNIYKLGEMLNDGQVKTIDLKKQWTMTFNEYVAKNEKLLRTLTGENAKVIDTGIITSDGKHLSITPGMALSIYMHNLNKDNLKHIVNGGMLFPDIELYKQGKISKSIEKGTKFVLTLGDIKSICKIVENDECLMQAVKLMKQLFEDQAQEINNNTIQLYGYEAAVIDNYFPIHTDKNFLNTDIEALKYDKSLEGSGFLKSRVHSPNPVILEDAFDTVLRQIDIVSQFCGLAVPISNFMKVYNIRAGYDTSFKQEIEKVWGKDTKAYIEKIVADLNGTKRSYSMLDRTRSNFAKAVLEINISVTMKQFSAYPIAAATLGWKPIIKALKKGLGRADIELIGKYTSLYWDRNQGNSDLIGKQGQKDIGDVARKRTREQKHQFIFNWIQKTDIAVVGRLWYASEYYVNDNFPELKNGSEDYYLKVAEIFNKTLQETQQMYTTMQMPGILRNDNKVVRELTMFMSQNLQEFGLLFEATNNLRAKSKVYKELKTKQAKSQLQKAKVQFARALSAKIVSSLMTGAIIFLVNFTLNKKDKYLDENGEMTIFSVGKQVGIDWLANIFGSMLGGSELYDLIYASITREQYYGIGLTSLQPIIDGLDDIYKLFTSNDFEQAKSRSGKLALDISQIFGIPLNNVMRIINGIYGNAMAIINGTMLTPDYANMNDSTKATAMYNALMKGDREKYAKIYNTFISQGKDDSDIQSKLKIMLKSQNDNVVNAAQALIDSNLDVYEKCVDKLVNLGFSIDTIQSAIISKKKEILKSDSAEETSENTKVYTTDELFGEKNGSSYSYSMLFDELKDGDITDYQRILNSMISDGISKKKIEQSMNSRKSALVNTYINAEDNGSDKADDYYQQLINVYGSKSKADTAISNKKKKQ